MERRKDEQEVSKNIEKKERRKESGADRRMIYFMYFISVTCDLYNDQGM